MKRFNKNMIHTPGFNLRIDLGYGILKTLSSTHALIYKKETAKVIDCLWEIDTNGLLVISYGTKNISHFLLLSETDSSLFVQELEKKSNGKFSKKEETEWLIIEPENTDLDDKYNFEDKEGVTEKINPLVSLIMIVFYFVQLIILIVIESLFDSISISSLFIVIFSSILYIAMIKGNFSLSESFYNKILKKYLD
jgi:hypothetical protein